MDIDEIIEFEKRLLHASVRSCAKELNLLLSADFVEFGTSGRIYNKEMIIERLPQELSSTFEAFDFKGVVLAPDVLQLRYKTKRKNDDGTESASIRSSIWKRIEGRWQMVFHQGTATAP